MNEIQQKACKKTAFLYAIKLLSKQDYSKFKLKNKLLSKQYLESDVDILIKELIHKKYLREDYYIEARVRGLMIKGYSIEYIQLKLNEEQIDLSFERINSFFSEYKVTEYEQINSLISKKLVTGANQEPLDYKQKVKILRFLASKGHTGDKVEQCFSNNFN